MKRFAVATISFLAVDALQVSSGVEAEASTYQSLRWNYSNFARPSTVNRLSGRVGKPRNGDLNYARCKLHPRFDLNHFIKERFVNGHIVAEQQYTSDAL